MEPLRREAPWKLAMCLPRSTHGICPPALSPQVNRPCPFQRQLSSCAVAGLQPWPVPVRAHSLFPQPNPAGAPAHFSVLLCSKLLERAVPYSAPSTPRARFPIWLPCPQPAVLTKVAHGQLARSDGQSLSSVHPNHWQLDQAHHSLLLGAVSSLGFQGAPCFSSPSS